MAAYWRAVATYARHTAHALRKPSMGQPTQRNRKQTKKEIDA